MYTIVALMGEAGSGKDTILHDIVSLDPNLHEIISCTSRPMREGEQEGKNYYYISEEEFCDKILTNEMIEVTRFNGWFYGTPYSSLKEDCINIGVFNPFGIRSLAEEDDVELITFYISTSPKERLLRQLNREESPDVDEIIRRFSADQLDFARLNFPYITLVNEDESSKQQAISIITATISGLRAEIDK